MKKIIKNILVFLSYFIYDSFFKSILLFFNINYNNLDTNYKVLISMILNIIYIIILILIYKNELKEEFKLFKEKYKEYLSKYLIIYLLGILLMIISNIILSNITNQSLSGNEIKIRDYINKYPLYMIFSSVLFAPIIEEFIFRKSLKNIFKYKYLFIFISGLIFGILHISNFNNLNEILFSIPYIIMGIDFAYIYYKTNNIFTTLTLHSCHNLILLLIQLFL